jgi:hypothetical protein
MKKVVFARKKENQPLHPFVLVTVIDRKIDKTQLDFCLSEFC